MFQKSLVSVCVMALAATAALADAPGYVAATWSDQSVHFLDAGFNNTGSFVVGSGAPNGIATDGSLIWTGHFTTQEIIAYNYAGAEQFRFSTPGYANLQGMDLVGRDIAFCNANDIVFFDAFGGGFSHTIPSQGFTIEGIAYDGTYLWQLDDSVIYATSPLTGAVSFTIPNPALGDPFDGTGLANAGVNELAVGSANGDWYVIRKNDGFLLASGNNGLDMYGLKAIPEPTSLALLAVAALVLRRR